MWDQATVGLIAPLRQQGQSGKGCINFRPVIFFFWGGGGSACVHNCKYYKNREKSTKDRKSQKLNYSAAKLRNKKSLKASK